MKFLVKALLLSLSFSPLAFAEDASEPKIVVSPISEVQNESSLVNDQFSVICLRNRTDVTMNYQWVSSGGSPTNYSLQPGYQQSFYWNDTNYHFINVTYDGDLTGGTAWKTYGLTAKSAQFPGCEYGNPYHFAKVGTRWVEIYSGLTP